jgi:hypothetical protein
MELLDFIYQDSNGNICKSKTTTKIDNQPRTGFKINQSNVDRKEMIFVSDNDNGNISLDRFNIVKLISKVTIENGVIQNECVVAFNNGDLIILPINSPEYLEAYLQHEIKKNELKSAFSKKDVKTRDVVTIFKGKNKEQFTYCGEVNVLYGSILNFKIGSADIKINKKILTKHLFLSKEKRTLLFLTTFPKIIEITGTNFVSDAEMFTTINKIIRQKNIFAPFYHKYNPFLFEEEHENEIIEFNYGKNEYGFPLFVLSTNQPETYLRNKFKETVAETTIIIEKQN